MIALIGKAAWRQARKMAPAFAQRWRGPWDDIIPFCFGDFIPNLEPVVYFAVREDGRYRFHYYHVYHYMDWVRTPWGYNHRHDFEGVIIFQHKQGGEVFALASRCHYAVKIVRDPKQMRLRGSHYLLAPIHKNYWFEIEPRGHGIRPAKKAIRGDWKAYLPGEYGLVNMMNPRFLAHWEYIREVFGDRAQMPDVLDLGRWWNKPMKLLKKWR